MRQRFFQPPFRVWHAVILVGPVQTITTAGYGYVTPRSLDAPIVARLDEVSRGLESMERTISADGRS
jgi:hypothetical protein